MKRFPIISDIARKQYENQFSVAHNDSLFSEVKKVFCVSYVDAAAAWTLEVVVMTGEKYTFSGTGPQAFYLPITFQSISAATGITKLAGFWLQYSA